VKIKTLLFIAIALSISAVFLMVRNMRSVNYPELPVLTDLRGQVFDPSVLNNKVYMLSYFQTWCSDCVKEQPQLEALQNKYGKDNLEIILITDETQEKVEQFVAMFNPKILIYRTESGLKKDLGIRAFPTTYLFGKDGKLLRKTVEGIDWNTEKVHQLIDAQLN